MNNLIEKFKDTNALIIGDIILDQFVYGTVSRISPEAPIPIIAVNKEKKMLGGAGNVLANINAMGCQGEIITLIGSDEAGQEIMQKVSDCGASIDGVIEDQSRPTILKTRYISQNQQLLRVDREDLKKVLSPIQKQILDKAEKLILGKNILVLSDYGKGVLSSDVIKSLIKLAVRHKIPVIVDPKGKDFNLYKGANIITPNRSELSNATNNHPTKNDEDIEKAAQILIKQSGFDVVIATRSEDGISVISKKEKPIHIKTQVREVYDVSGAGDTVVAAIAAVMGAGGDLNSAAQIANIAGGIAVSKLGTAIVSAAEIKAMIDGDENNASRIAPMMDWEKAKEQIEKWQAKGLKVGFTNGCFDILHYGHVNYLDRARGKCDRLVLGLNHDTSVKILKGESRPINDEMARAAVMGALTSVDLVVLFGATKQGEDNTPCALVDYIRPDVLMKGGDYTIDQLPEGKVVQAYGGKVEIMPLYEGFSTTNIINKSKVG